MQILQGLSFTPSSITGTHAFFIPLYLCGEESEELIFTSPFSAQTAPPSPQKCFTRTLFQEWLLPTDPLPRTLSHASFLQGLFPMAPPHCCILSLMHPLLRIRAIQALRTRNLFCYGAAACQDS